MWIRALLVAAAVALLAPAPASALQHKIALVAYGEGTTTCVVTTNKVLKAFWGGETRYEFFGRTECSVPVQQSGQAQLAHDDPSLVEVAPLCSAFTARCESRDYVQGVEYQNGTRGMTYRVTLRAPHGQGWLTAPQTCSGVGSDNLTCTFTNLSESDTLLLNDV